MSSISGLPSMAITDEIYIAAMPLRAMKGPAQFLMSAAFSLQISPLQHFMLIIKPSISIHPRSQNLVFDFQPQDPENVYVALAALSGRPVPGIILERKMSQLPKNRCWYIGSSKQSDSVEAAYSFNSSWATDLRIGQHDCRHYTNALAEFLTGETDALDRLPTNYSN